MVRHQVQNGISVTNSQGVGARQLAPHRSLHRATVPVTTRNISAPTTVCPLLVFPLTLFKVGNGDQMYESFPPCGSPRLSQCNALVSVLL